MSRYIDAERLKQFLKPIEWGTPDERWIPEHEIGAMLDYFPAADVVEVRHGRWIYRQLPMPLSDGSKECVECSVCHTHWDGEMNFCPNCGASMQGEEDANE